MTQNQIAYWNYVEQKRSNQAKEVETNRSNLADEFERNRHNLAAEVHDQNSLIEASRHNRAAEKSQAVSAAASASQASAAHARAANEAQRISYEYPWEGWHSGASTVTKVAQTAGQVVKTVGELFS